jgi:hypothetical protein
MRRPKFELEQKKYLTLQNAILSYVAFPPEIKVGMDGSAYLDRMVCH